MIISQDIKKLYFLIDKYLDEQSNGDKVLDYCPPDELANQIQAEILSNGQSIDNLFANIDSYLKYCVHTGNRQFFNQLYAGFNFPAFVGDVITSLTNTSMYTYEVAPAATILELAVIDKMCQHAGYTSGDGILVTGGSNANLIAMFSARNRVAPASKRLGLYGTQPLCAFVSDQSHYSFGTAANVLGIGS